MAGEWWSGIEMRHLVALDAVAREGSFRRAATRLGYVQSAISHQIAALEALIGKRLIDRSRGTRPLALTPAGEILLSHADALIARVRAAQADLAALDGVGAAALRVGATPDLLTHLVPSLLRAYGAPVTLNEAPTGRSLLAALIRGELDLALAETPLPKGPLDAVLLCSDSFVAVIQAGAPLAKRGVLSRPASWHGCRSSRMHRVATTWRSSCASTASNHASSSRQEPVRPSRDSSRRASALPSCLASRSTSAEPRRSSSSSRTTWSRTGWSLRSGRACSLRATMRRRSSRLRGRPARQSGCASR